MKDKVADQPAQIKPPIEAIAEGAQVLGRVLGELEGLVSAVDHCLEVAQHGVDPGELGQLARLAVGHHDVGVGAAGVDHAREAAQAVTAYIAARHQVHARPVSDGLGCEPGNRTDLGLHRMPSIVGGYRCHDGHLVGRAAATHARSLTPEVGIVHLNRARERGFAVALRHRGHQFVANQPGRTVRGPQLAHQGQRRQAGLCLTEQVDRQKPGPQRQLGTVRERAGGQRGLVPAGLALVKLAGSMTDDVVLRGRAMRAAKTPAAIVV